MRYYRMVIIAWVFMAVYPAHGIEIWSSQTGDRYFVLNSALKWTSLLSYAPADSLLFPERWSGTSLWRMRLAAAVQPASWINAHVAYEQRARSISEGSGTAGGSGFLLLENRVPYRLSQLDAALVNIGRTFSYRHELDRVFTAIHIGEIELTIGRQALGWGRALLFGAVDIFAPFTPLESDREWRRGVDAVRGTVPITDLISLEAVAALGESPKESAYVGRLQGYFGDIDGELIFGRRTRDYFWALTTSAPLHGAEIHGEFAFFKTPETIPDGGILGNDHLVMKTVIGSSYSFTAVRQLLITGEYHYSGFGIKDIKQIQMHLADTAFLERIQRGDSQIVGRHAGAVQLAYGIDGTAPLNLSWIFSPVDGSGVLTPSVRWIFSDNITLVGQFYLAHGSHPVGGNIRSEYGGTPTGGLVQINWYY